MAGFMCYHCDHKFWGFKIYVRIDMSHVTPVGRFEPINTRNIKAWQLGESKNRIVIFFNLSTKTHGMEWKYIIFPIHES